MSPFREYIRLSGCSVSIPKQALIPDWVMGDMCVETQHKHTNGHDGPPPDPGKCSTIVAACGRDSVPGEVNRFSFLFLVCVRVCVCVCVCVFVSFCCCCS